MPYCRRCQKYLKLYRTGHIHSSNSWSSVKQLSKKARILTEPGGAGASSYAVNSLANSFRQSTSDKILLLEYNKVIANVAGPDATDVWTERVAPRHLSTLNVLYADGHVDALRPEAINPRVESIQDAVWCP